MDFLGRLFSDDGFMPHGHCYLWNGDLIRLHLVSDFLIAAAYFTIPFTLIHFVRKRRDVPFNWMFVCFGVFMIACGLTHVMEMITLWSPYYWLSGMVKAITAVTSVPTAILLIRLIPSALSILGPSVLRAANEALIEQTKLLSLIVTNMGDGLMVVDRNGHTLLSNPATWRMLNLKGEEEVPKNCPLNCAFYRADKVTRIAAEESPISKAVAGENISGQQIFIRHQENGEGCWADVTARPLRDEDGIIHGAVAVFRDITSDKIAAEHEESLLQERAARAEAEAANQAKDKFLAMLGHELRTPLTPVLAGVQLLEQQANGSGEVRDTLQIIRRNVELEARLIDDILDLSAITRGKIALELDTVDVHALLRRTLEILATDLAHRKLRVHTRFSAADHFVRADGSRLMQVFWNVIKNSIKFTAEEGSIYLETRNEERNLIIEVSDNGVGIELEFLPRIFDSFEQGVRQLHAGHGGLGLGLAISRVIIEAHQGQIEVKSPGPNRGTIVTVALVVVPAPHPNGHKTVLSGEEKNLTTPKLRILLVDDHTDTVTTLGTLLRRIGYDVVCAETAKEARELAARLKFDLLVTDIGLPDGSGHDLMREIRERQAIPGVALSGFGMEEDLAKSRAVGFVDHLIKPVNVERLQAVLQKVATQSSR